MDGFTLKVLMSALMLLDHLYEFFPEVFPIWFRWLGRLVAPVFFFLMVEAVAHTRSKKAYIMRLLAAGGVTWLGLWGIARFCGVAMPPNNIFLSLACSAGIAWAMMAQRDDDGGEGHRPAALAIILAVASLFTEAGFYGILMTVCFVLCRGKPRMLAVAYPAVSLGMSVLPFWSNLSIHYLFYTNPQWMMVSALPFLLLYNGKRGVNGGFAKWFFYLYYPGHLFLLFWLAGAGSVG